MAVIRVGIPATSLQLTTTPGDVVYTCPAGKQATIIDLSELNTTATDRTVTWHIVRSGGSIADNNQVVSAAPVSKETVRPRGEIEYAMIGKTLNPGDFIQGFGSAASALTPMGTIEEVSQ